MALLETQCGDLQRAVLASGGATATSFASKIPVLDTSASKPVKGDAGTSGGVIQVGPEEGPMPNNLLVIPFGLGADDSTFEMRVLGWRKTKGTPAAKLWIPVPLVAYTCTLSTAVGVTAGYLSASERICDTIVIVSGFGNANVDTTVNSPTGNVIGHFTFDMKGFDLIEFCFDLTGATGANALYSPF